MNYNPFSIEGKNILITGASSGIGQVTAIECSKLGAKLFLTARNSDRLLETMSKLSGESHSYQIADLKNSTDTDNLIRNLPKLDGVIHSAGLIKRLPLKFINEKAFQDLLDTNFTGPAMLTQKLVKHKLLNPFSSIVFYSSVASSFASLGNIMYMASKGAINSFMKGIAFELAQQQIRVNAIQPGMIKTPLSAQIEEDTLVKDISNYPLGRYGTPEEVAWAAVYLLSDASRWMTGSLLTIDGGLTLR